MSKETTIAILMTCFNRKDKTRECLESLTALNNNTKNYKFCFYVVDDGCTDGTTEMLDGGFQNLVHLIGDGNLYWTKGMNLAFKEAVKKKYDFYLWVNDDVKFFDNSIIQLLDLYKNNGEMNSIFSGYMVGKDMTTVTYGGQKLQKGFVPLNLKNIMPKNDELVRCDSVHGNCVLIPQDVVAQIGLIDDFYSHGFGDIDYSLRASKAGINVYLSNFAVGVCEPNPRDDRVKSFRNKSFKERFKIMNSVYYRPIKDWYHFTKKFGGKLWLLRFIAPYIKLALNIY